MGIVVIIFDLISAVMNVIVIVGRTERIWKIGEFVEGVAKMAEDDENGVAEVGGEGGEIGKVDVGATGELFRGGWHRWRGWRMDG